MLTTAVALAGLTGVHLSVLLRRRLAVGRPSGASEPSRAAQRGLLPVVAYAARVADGTCLYVSPAVELLVGRPPERLVGGERPWLDRAFPPDRREADAAFATWRAGPMATPFRARYRVLAPTMGVVWVEETTYVARATDGDAVVLRGRLVLNRVDTSVEPPEPHEPTG